MAEGNAWGQKTRQDGEELHRYRFCWGRLVLKSDCGTKYLGKETVEGQSPKDNQRQKQETLT